MQEVTHKDGITQHESHAGTNLITGYVLEVFSDLSGRFLKRIMNVICGTCDMWETFY